MKLERLIIFENYEILSLLNPVPNEYMNSKMCMIISFKIVNGSQSVSFCLGIR